MAVLYVNNYKFSETAIKNNFGIYIKDDIFYTKNGQIINFPEKYLKACLKNKANPQKEKITFVPKSERIKKYCIERNLIQDEFGTYEENGIHYTCLGEIIHDFESYRKTCIRNLSLKKRFCKSADCL